MWLCPWEDPRYLIFSSNVPDVLYYSHIPAIIAALLFGGFIFLHNKTSTAKNLLTLLLLFSLYTTLDLVIWASNRPDLVLFLWSMQVLLEPFIFLFSLYFTYFFLGQKSISSWTKIVSAFLIIPFILLIPTRYNLVGARLATCDATEGLVALYYSYALEVFLTVWIAMLCVKAYRATQGRNDRKRIFFFTMGLLSLLLAFSWGNIVGSFTEDWVVAQYGLFGMPVFIVLLVFLIVRYRAFNIKLIGAQALVISLALLIGSQFFFIHNNTNRILTAITLVLTTLFGWGLIRSVKEEILRKEELQEISDRLAVANTELHRLDTAKSEFISIASHQLRTPLTAIKGFVSLLLEGAYGRLEPSVADTLNKVYLANARLVNLVENLLNISRIEAGRIQYQFAPTRLEDILTELHELFILAAHEKGIRLGITLPKTPLPMLSLDGAKIREVISNMIDNSIKYTERGEVLIVAEQQGNKVVVTVSDTGVGIDPEDLPHLFKKFERGKDAAQVNVSSTGLGLYVGKSFTEAHGGTIRAESAGKGKGARFVLELPVDREVA